MARQIISRSGINNQKLIYSPTSIFLPNQLPGLAAWYSADYGVLTSIGPDVPATDGQTVRRWLDRSGNGRHLDQATLLNQPTLTSGRVLFDGVASKMTASSISSNPYSQYFAAALTRVSSDSSWNYFCDGATVDRSPIFSGRSVENDVSQPKNSSFACGGPGSIIAVGAYAAYGTVPIIIGSVVNGESSRFRIGSSTTLGNAGTLHPNGSIIIGAHGNGAFYGKIDMREYVMFAGSLSVSDENKLAAYFARRWGVLT